VSLPYATYGIAVEDGVVAQAPPVAKWMLGKDERYCANWLRRKGATLVPLG
jgi:hypothetical protein